MKIFDKAIDKYKKVADSGGVIAGVKNFFAKNLDNIKKIIHRMQHLRESNESLAYYHFRRGNVNDALLRFKIMQKVDAKPVYNFFMGRLYWEKGKMDKSLHYLDLYLKSSHKKFTKEAEYCKKLASLDSLEIKTVPEFIVHHNYTNFYYAFESRLTHTTLSESKAPFFDALTPLLKESKVTGSISVLDLGCGDGLLGYCCYRDLKCTQITGVELVVQLASLAETRKIKDKLVYDEVIVDNFFDWHKATKTHKKYDLILAEHFVSYDHDVKDALTKITKHLSAGGLLAVSFNATQKFKSYEFNAGNEAFAFNPEYVKEVLAGLKLKVIGEKQIIYSKDSIDQLILVKK